MILAENIHYLRIYSVLIQRPSTIDTPLTLKPVQVSLTVIQLY